MREAEITRDTKETKISFKLNIDGSGRADVSTGIAFFDHMLQLIARHGFVDLSIEAKGDIEVDYHHLVEDMGISMGQAVKEALSDKAGITRYGFFVLPMDETLVTVAPMIIGTMTDQDRCIPHIEIVYGIRFPVHPFDTLLKLDVPQLGRFGEFFQLTGEGYLSLLCDGMSICDLDPFGLRN